MLKQLFHGGHLSSELGRLNAIHNQKDSPVNLDDHFMGGEDAGPDPVQHIQLNGSGGEKPKEAVVDCRLSTQAAGEGCDTQDIGS